MYSNILSDLTRYIKTLFLMKFQYTYILQYNQYYSIKSKYIKLQIYKHFTFINLFKDLASYSWEILSLFRELVLSEFPDLISLRPRNLFIVYLSL